MSKEVLQLCFLLALGAAYAEVQVHEPFHVKFQWNFVDYTWPSEEAYQRAKGGIYVQRNNVISSIKIYKDRMYLAIPRSKHGVPVTLASTSAKAVDGNASPLLEPFPSWDFQTEGVCGMLQSVQNMEIDPKGRMWVLDSGRAMNAGEESALRPCGASLRIFDLENRGTRPNEELGRFVIPADVADPRTAHLYDIVLDHEDGGMAYVSDADPTKPGIIVFSLRSRTFRKVSHSSMFASKDGSRFQFDSRRFLLRANVHALALSPASSAQGNRTLYYSPLSSLRVYSISTHVLKNETLRADMDSHVKILTDRADSQIESMAMSNTGVLYLGDLENDAIRVWDSRNSPFGSGQRMVSRDHYLLQWPTSFTFDNNGTVWCLSNRMPLSLNGSIKTTEANFLAMAANVSYTSYQYLEDGSVPPLPEISAAGSSSFNASHALAF